MLRKFKQDLPVIQNERAPVSSGVRSFLSMGSNIGGREEFLRMGIMTLVSGGFMLETVSGLYETAPVGCEPGAGAFLNCAVGGLWHSTPEELLRLCRLAETAAGRPARHGRWVSRTLDVDIVLFGSVVMDTPELTLPHPMARERLFVIEPLAEIAPDAVFPDTRLAVSEMLAALRNRV